MTNLALIDSLESSIRLNSTGFFNFNIHTDVILTSSEAACGIATGITVGNPVGNDFSLSIQAVTKPCPIQLLAIKASPQKFYCFFPILCICLYSYIIFLNYPLI